MAACQAFDPLSPYISAVVSFVDCQARTLGEGGYRALGSDSPIGIAIAGLITIYIALIGYRLLLGETIGVRESVMAAVKIGLVLALATQWSAYRTLVYDVVIAGPGELAGRILAPSGLGGDDANNLVARVQASYGAIDAVLHPDPATTAQAAPNPGNPDGISGLPTGVPAAGRLAVPAPGFLTATNLILLVGTLTALLSVRVVAGLLLALGPLFIGCLLFDATRGLFIGWLQVLIGAALGAIATPAVIAIELAILEPQVRLLGQIVSAGEFVPILPGELLATVALFALVLAITLFGTARAAAAIHFPERTWPNVETVIRPRDADARTIVMADRQRDDATQTVSLSRAQSLADAITNHDRSLASADALSRDQSRLSVLGDAVRATRVDDSPAVQPLGQRGRRTARRVSQSAAQRDTTA